MTISDGNVSSRSSLPIFPENVAKPDGSRIDCPKCKRPVTVSGELTTEDLGTLPVFQCDHCTVPWDFDGERFETALTFALTPDGDVLDPETLEALP